MTERDDSTFPNWGFDPGCAPCCRSAPLWPPISRDRVHIWRVAFDSEVRPAAAFDAVLNTDEQARAARFVHSRDRRYFIVRQAALRTILASYLGLQAAQVEFVSGPHGKPALAAASGLRFNVSHAGPLGLVAVACDREIGVDIERIREGVDLHGIARSFLPSQDAQALRALAPEDQLAAFFRCWCSREACVKALGIGLARGLDGGPADGLLLAMHAPDWTGTTGRWSVSAVDVDQGFVARLAVEGGMCQIERFRYLGAGASDDA
jgi:4'-phosphopantetheinyl transferase